MGKVEVVFSKTTLTVRQKYVYAFKRLGDVTCGTACKYLNQFRRNSSFNELFQSDPFMTSFRTILSNALYLYYGLTDNNIACVQFTANRRNISSSTQVWKRSSKSKENQIKNFLQGRIKLRNTIV